MDMPALNDAHKKLEALVGDWEGEETLYPSPMDPVGGRALARIRNVLALEGFAVIHDYAQQRQTSVNFRGHGVFTWKADLKLYSLFWFDSLGLPPMEFRGTFDGGELVLVHQGEKGFTRATYTFPQPGHYAFREQVSPDGKQWVPFLEGHYALQGK